ncbi:hypothetical protein M758_10G162300 [Ceratodon purpureus]|nr:hypothetical protein M758_10G162300 [Ceratodon purpureus]
MITMGVQSATLLNLQCVVIMVLLLCPAEALRKASTLNLASMRIYTAELQLRESGRAASVLEEHCPSQLEAVRNSLHHSGTKVVVDPDAARRELVQVDAFLQSCGQKLSAAVNSQAFDLLTRVGQSVASAEYLIDQSDITESTQAPLQGVVSDDSSDQEAIDFEGEVADGSTLLATRVKDGRFKEWDSGEATRSGQSVVPVAPRIKIPMDDMVVDFCPNHVDLTKSSATIRLDRACGGKFHTRAKYSSGVFSIRMRAPEGAPGVSNSFFISSNDATPDTISFDFVGNEPNRVLTAYAVNGDHDQKLKTFHMGFDTTKEFHVYTIKWDEASIIWMVDDVVLRTLRSSRVEAYPTKAGHVYGYSWDATSVTDGALAGRINWYNAPYFMSFRNLQVASPLRVDQWRPPQQRLLSSRGVPSPVRPLVIDYCPTNIAAHPGGYGVDITFDKYGCGGRVRSLHSYSSGRFSASIKCAEGDTSGLLTSFYISSGEGTTTQDEIDFEFLGDNKQIVQTNFYVNGTSANEQWVELDYDCSSGFHTYTIEYSESQIQWFVDSRLVRTVVKEDQVAKSLAYPHKKMFLYSSVWNASFVNDGGWTGKWHGMGELPFVAKFKDVTMQF